MKKVLLASTALVMSAGFAAADVSVGGDGRMGVIDGFNGTLTLDGPDGLPGTPDDITVNRNDELTFTSRIRIIFTASGETDSGLAFGGTIRADNAGNVGIVDAQGRTPGDDGFNPATATLQGGGTFGGAGSVFIEGSFGKLSMGDVDGAAEAAVGYVSGVGLTGLSDLNENIYIAGPGIGGSLPAALYEYSGGDWAVYVSATSPTTFVGVESDINYSVGGSYAFGNFSVAAGYENNDALNTDHWILGGTATFGDFTGKLIWGTASGDADGDQWGISGDYTFDATTVTAFYTDSTDIELAGSSIGTEAWGLGAAYDLGGGASLVGGYVSNETSGEDAYDFGIAFTF